MGKLIFLSVCTLFLTGCEFFAEKEGLREVRIGTQTFLVEIADSREEWSRGLMFREKLEPNHGMLFVFDEEGLHPFWMKNTLIPLDVIWISGDGKVIDKQTVSPCIEDPCPVYSPENKAKYALEVNAGEFEGKKGDGIW